MKRRLVSLKPNELNATLFAESLTEESIRLLADDMGKNGQYSPILTTPGGLIIDGERRWRAAQMLKWAMVEVTVVKIRSKHALLSRIMGSVTAARHMTLREQVLVYQGYRKQLRRLHGRRVGRPAGDDVTRYMSPDEIKLAAMKLAHIPFRSADLMDQLVAVFEQADPEVQERVNRYDLSISRAYETIRRAPADSTPEDPDDDGDEPIDEIDLTVSPEPAAPEPLVTEALPEDEAIKAVNLSIRPPTPTGPRPPPLTGEDDLDALLGGVEQTPPAVNRDPHTTLVESIQALWTLESPESAIERLVESLETAIGSLKDLDFERARNCVRWTIRPVILRIGTAFVVVK